VAGFVFEFACPSHRKKLLDVFVSFQAPWAGPLIPHNQHTRIQPPQEHEETAEGRAGESGDWPTSRRRQRGQPENLRPGTRGATSEHPRWPANELDRLVRMEERLDILACRLLDRFAPDHHNRAGVHQRQDASHANEGRVLYLTDGQSMAAEDGAVMSRLGQSSRIRAGPPCKPANHNSLQLIGVII